MRLSTAFLWPALVAAKCHRKDDPCLKRLIEQGGSGKEYCSQYFQPTHTVATVTETSTIPETETPTLTTTETKSDFIESTYTDLVEHTLTESVFTTTTTTVETTVPTRFVSILRQDREGIQLPGEYRDFCKGQNNPKMGPTAPSPTDQFQSACSCIGVTTTLNKVQKTETATVTSTNTADAITATTTSTVSGVDKTISTIITTTLSTETVTSATTTTTTRAAPAAVATYKLIAHYLDWCQPRGLLEEDSYPQFSANSVTDAFEQCASRCESIGPCVQIWVSWNQDLTQFGCDLGTGRPTRNGWDSSYVQCGLQHVPFLHYAYWYQSKYALELVGEVEEINMVEKTDEYVLEL